LLSLKIKFKSVIFNDYKLLSCLSESFCLTSFYITLSIDFYSQFLDRATEISDTEVKVHWLWLIPLQIKYCPFQLPHLTKVVFIYFLLLSRTVASLRKRSPSRTTVTAATRLTSAASFLRFRWSQFATRKPEKSSFSFW
jgi:hypothetical protein